MAEKKYIDAEAVGGVLDKEYNRYGFGWSAMESHAMSVIDSIYRGIRELPAADVVEVVRCKDCKWYCKSDPGHPDCDFCKRLICGTIKPDFYCADGERKEKTDDKR